MSNNQYSKYSEFNKWVYDYYVDRNEPGSAGCLAIDEYDYECSGFKNIFFPEIHMLRWSRLLGVCERYGIPQYFGLVGLQCIAATAVDSNRIREKFCEIAGIDSIKTLTPMYTEDYASHHIQEVIWRAAQRFLFTKHSIRIEIVNREGPYRYVRPSKSQVVLNRNDLKEYKDLFQQIDDTYQESISIAVFKQELKKYIEQFPFSTSNNKNRELSEIEENVKGRQVLNYYNSDAWRDESYVKKTYNRSEDSSFSIQIIHDVVTLFKGNSVVSPSVAIRIKHLWVFERDSLYADEYGVTKSIDEQGDYVVMCYSSHRICILKLGRLLSSSTDIEFRMFRRSDILPVLEPYFRDYLKGGEAEISLEGLRIGRSNVYLVNAGPVIKFAGHFSVYRNGERIEYRPNECSPGNYCVKRPDFTDIKFKVIEPEYYDESFAKAPEGLGISLARLDISYSGPRLNGFVFLGDEASDKPGLTINNWIKATSSNSTLRSDSLFLKMIKAYSNGN